MCNINKLVLYRNALSSQSETEKMCDHLKLELSNIKAEYKLIESSTGGQQKEKKYKNIMEHLYDIIYSLCIDFYIRIK